jgi:hypothetical protein
MIVWSVLGSTSKVCGASEKLPLLSPKSDGASLYEPLDVASFGPPSEGPTPLLLPLLVLLPDDIDASGSNPLPCPVVDPQETLQAPATTEPTNNAARNDLIINPYTRSRQLLRKRKFLPALLKTRMRLRTKGAVTRRQHLGGERGRR